MKTHRPFTAVTFDVGGTLIEPWPSVGHVYAEVATEWGIAGAAPEALNRGFATAWLAGKPFDHSRAAWQRLVNLTFEAAGTARPSDACFAAIYLRFAQASAWRVFEDVRPALEALAARGLRLGIVSNWDERLRPLLVELGLAEFFRASIISCEAGHMKPDPETFMRAAAELDCEPAAMLHVGDNMREDVEGARAAGLRAVLIDRNGRHGESESARSADSPPPCVGGYEVILSFMALTALLETADANGNLD
jgi:putative hydrolase of the HAD superfamily